MTLSISSVEYDLLYEASNQNLQHNLALNVNLVLLPVNV